VQRADHSSSVRGALEAAVVVITIVALAFGVWALIVLG
jgi:hypothetical protein